MSTSYLSQVGVGGLQLLRVSVADIRLGDEIRNHDIRLVDFSNSCAPYIQ